MGAPDEGAGVKVSPPLLYLAFLVLGVLVSAWYPFHVFLAATAWTLGGVLIAAGVLLGPIWGVLTLRRAGTTTRPDRPSQKFVTSGPFRFSRNPLYLALTLMYAGLALIANSAWALLLLIPVILVMQRFVISREEAYLARTFGAEYEDYKANVRRWL